MTTQKKDFEENNLFDISKDNELKNELSNIDIENLTPMQALAKLEMLVEIAKRG